MVGVLFIVTIPTEQEERNIELNEKHVKFGHSSAADNSNQENDKFEYGTFKIWTTDGFLMDKEFRNGGYMDCTGLLNNLPANSTMECIMNEMFKKFHIDNAVWQLSKNTKYYQITFFVETNVCHELVLTTLNEWGIGEKNGSCMSMIPCAIYSEPTKPSSSEPIGIGRSRESMSEQRKQTAWNKFMSSITARWNVAQIVQRVKNEATITFDFITLILVAGMLASFGLLDNDTTTVISSMLISPLMGPVIATIFGIVIKDYALVRFGLVNEVIGILIATCIGFTFGLIICTVDSKYAYGTDTALTTEMIKRCEFHSLLFGILTALPTGAASAIAVLSENSNSGPVVGVAISVSLLPPAVNAGIFWALAVLYKLNEKDETLYDKIVMTSYYSNHQSIELAVYGGISMLLTIANVICIQVVGVLTLKFKEVAPPQHQHRLWEHDIKIARDYNTTTQSTDDGDLTASQQIVKENLANMKKNDEKFKRLYGHQSYRNNWSSSGMHSSYPLYGHDATISDLESISLCMEYPTRPTPIRSQFDTKPIRIPSNKNRSPVSTSPPSPSSSKMYQSRSSPSLFSNLQSMSKFRLEKIPEVPPAPLSTAIATETVSSSSTSNENHDTINSPDNAKNSENSQNYLITSSNEVK